MREGIEIRRHPVGRGHGPEGADTVMDAPVRIWRTPAALPLRNPGTMF